MNVGKSSQLEKYGFGSLHNITWACYDTEDTLLRHRPRFTNEFACASLNSLPQDERSAICSSEVVLFETLFTFITYIYISFMSHFCAHYTLFLLPEVIISPFCEISRWVFSANLMKYPCLYQLYSLASFARNR